MTTRTVAKNVAKGVAIGVLVPAAVMYVAIKHASTFLSTVACESLDTAHDWVDSAEEGIGEAWVKVVKRPTATKKPAASWRLEKSFPARSVGAAAAGFDKKMKWSWVPDADDVILWSKKQYKAALSWTEKQYKNADLWIGDSNKGGKWMFWAFATLSIVAVTIYLVHVGGQVAAAVYVMSTFQKMTILVIATAISSLVIFETRKEFSDTTVNAS